MQMQSIDTKMIYIMTKDKGILYPVAFGVKTLKTSGTSYVI